MGRTWLRKILRDVWSRKARTALVTISIFIGVFGTVTLFSMGDLLVRQMEKDLKPDELAMIRSYIVPKLGASVDNAATLETLRGLDASISDVEGQMVYPITWRKAGEDAFQSSNVFGYSEPFGEIDIEPMRLIEGTWPQGEGHKELVVERRLADKYGLGLGDKVVVRILSTGDSPSDEAFLDEEWAIVGLVFFPYAYEGGFNAVLAEDSLFASLDNVEYIAATKGLTSVYARFNRYTEAEAHYEAFIETIVDETPYLSVYNFKEDPEQNSKIAFSRTTGNVLAVLAILALIVSGFLVFNVISSIVNEQKRQIGVMKSLGADWRDNYLIYSGMAFLYGLMAVIPGVLLGVPMGFKAAQGLAVQSDTLIENFDFSLRAIVMGVVMGLAVPVVASFLPVYGGTRVKILDAITDLGIDSEYGKGRLARWVGRLPLSINIRQGVSNVLQKKWRMAFTVLTLTIAAGAFMGVFAVFTSVNTLIDDFLATFNFNFYTIPNLTSVDEDLADAERIILADMGGLMTAKGPYTVVAGRIDGYEKIYDPNTGPPALFVYGYEPETEAYLLTIDDGVDLIARPDGVVITQLMAKEIGVTVGDAITLRVGSHVGDYEVVGVSSYPFDGAWMHWRNLSELAGFTDKNGEPAPRGILWTVKEDEPDVARVNELIRETHDALLQKGVTAESGNIEQFKASVLDTVSLFGTIFNLTAWLIALVGAVGLLTTLSMSVFERQKEIGVMRSVGASSGTIISQFLTEGLVVGLIAWLLGIPLSYFLSKGLVEAMNLGDSYQLDYPPIAILVGLGGMLVLTTLASIWPSLAAARKTVSDILRYQ